MELNNWLKRVLVGGLYVVLLIPLYVSGGMFFPFITGKNFAFRIIVEILALVWFWLWVSDKSIRIKRTWIAYGVAGLVITATLATIFGANPYHSFWSNYERMDGLVGLLHMGLYFVLLASTLTSEKLGSGFFHTSMGVALLASLYGFGQLAGKLVINQGGVRLDATFGNATYLAVYMLFHIFIAAFYMHKNWHIDWTRYVYTPLIVIYGIILYHTATRGAILGLIGGTILAFAIVGFKSSGRARKMALGGIAVVIILMGSVFALRNNDFVKSSQTLSRFANISLTEITTQSRFIIWGISLKGVKENPILGWGPENYNIVFNKYYEPELWRQETWFDRSHNILLDWFVTAGALGLMSYLALFFGAVYMIWRKNNESSSDFSLGERAILTGLFGAYFIQNLFVFDNLISYMMFFSLLGYLHMRGSVEARIIFVPLSRFWSKIRTLLSGAYQPVAISIMALFILFAIYFINVKPIQANREMIRTLYPRTLTEEKFKAFEHMFSLNTFGSTEAREQLIFLLTELRGRSNIDQNLFTRALEFTQAQMLKELSRSGNDARHQLFMGSFYQTFGRPVDALKHYTLAHELSPNKQIIMFSIESIYIINKQFDKALEIAKKAYDLDPSYDQARIRYATAAVYNKDNDLAEELLLPRYGTVLVADSDLINAYVSTGQMSKVIAIWKIRLEANPGDKQAYLSLAASYYTARQDDLAIQTLQKMAAFSPDFKQEADYYIEQIRQGKLSR